MEVNLLQTGIFCRKILQPEIWYEVLQCEAETSLVGMAERKACRLARLGLKRPEELPSVIFVILPIWTGG